MITKNQTKALYYLDRDTDINALIDEIIEIKKSELEIFLNRQLDRLQEKDAGEYYTIEDISKLKEGELEKMNRFFRGAVIPYYLRQNLNFWEKDIPTSLIIDTTDEIKKMVGFMKYGHDGHITNEVNSLTTFERVKDLNEFINTVKNVCFDDNDYIFPDSEYFEKLEKEKGREAAQRQVTRELYEKFKNKFYKREII